MKTLDVTQIEPRLKHPTIFNNFDALSGGQALVIHNDHDPKPLYYQLLAERGETFDWEYLLEGPSIWEVKISKLEENNSPTTLGELVAEDFRKAEVFRRFGLDFCCGGSKSLIDACEEKGLNTNEVKTALFQIDKTPINNHQNYNEWDLDFLSDYIINTHHKYVTNSISMLREYSLKVADAHGEHHPEVIEIAKLFAEIAKELDGHMQREEEILFPYVKQLSTQKKEGISLKTSTFNSIKNPISVMEEEHESAGENFAKIHQLSNSYSPPEDACPSYRVLYAKLEEFEKDLHQHIHLENNILFPKAIELEKELKK